MNLDLLNTDAARYLLGIREKNRIVKVTPNSYHLDMGKGLIKATFFTRDKVKQILEPIQTKMDIADKEWKKIENPYKAFLHYSGLERYNYPQIYLDTFYTATGGDGEIENTGAVWATVHDALIGETLDDTGATMRAFTRLTGGTYTIVRSFTPFDTSSIVDSATVTSATYSIYGTAKTDGTAQVALVKSTQVDPADLVIGDYDQVTTTEVASRLDIGAYSTSGYNDFTITDLTVISLSGYSKFAVRIGEKDVDNVAPGNTVTDSVTFSTAEAAGTTQDPKLVVNYSVAGGSYAYFM